MIAGRDHVLVVKVGGAEQMQEGQVPALAFVEGTDLLRRGARAHLHEPHPAVLVAVHESHRTKAWRESVLVGPFEQRIPVPRYPERSGFVDDARAGSESEDAHGSAVAVIVAQVSADGAEWPWRLLGDQRHAQVVDVAYQAFEELSVRLDPLLRATSEPAGKNGIFGEQAAQGAAVVQRLDETAKTRLGSGAVESAVEPR